LVWSRGFLERPTDAGPKLENSYKNKLRPQQLMADRGASGNYIINVVSYSRACQIILISLVAQNVQVKSDLVW
jgi:hypothetical protein